MTDQYLPNRVSNYIENKNIGKEAHKAKVFIENFLHKENDINHIIDFYEMMAKIGQERQLIGFFTKR